jgi:hypothetical protein
MKDLLLDLKAAQDILDMLDELEGYRENLDDEWGYVPKKKDSIKCTCKLEVLMISGCKCGAIEKERKRDKKS